MPLIGFPWAICTSQVNCLRQLDFQCVNGVILGTVAGKANISGKVKTSNSVPPNCLELYLLTALSLSALTLKQVIRSCPSGASRKIRFTR